MREELKKWLLTQGQVLTWDEIWQAAWNAALEKAAGVACQAVSPDGFDSGVNDLLLDVREAIRALEEG